MVYLELYAGWIALFFFAVVFAGAIATSMEHGFAVRFGLAMIILGAILTSVFGVVWIQESLHYGTVVSTQTVNLVNVSHVSAGDNISGGNAQVEYLSNGILKSTSYTGPITVSATAKKATVDVQIRKNIYGWQETVLAHLVVPENLIKKGD